MMDAAAMFAPLTEAQPSTTSAPRAKPAGDWLPELPAPEDPPAAPRHPKHGTPSATWTYRDAEGRPLFMVARFDPPDGKEILPLAFGTLRGRRGWHWKGPPSPSPLYRLHDLAARPDAAVLMVEGEKTAEAAALLFPAHVATTWQGGATAAKRADWTPLAGRRVVMWPDHDAPGRKAAADVVKACRAAGAASVAVVQIPDAFPPKWDVADPPPDGITADTLRDMLAGASVEPARVETPGDMAADAAEIARLAALSPLDYDRERQEAAELLGIRVTTLDAEVAALRPKPDATNGRTVDLPAVEPWPKPVDGGALLDALAATIRRHVILPPAAADCCALWIAHTWVHERFQHSPRLSITSPAKRCGKSTLLDVLRATCARPVKADNISASGVFRTVEALRPLTLLIDEADAFLGDNEELRGVLNSGFERSGEVIRVVEVQGEHQPIRFATYAPVALAGIGALPSTLEDRAVPVVLQRKGAAETVVKLRAPGARAALHDLARQLARWGADRAGRLSTDPAVPDAMGDREGDIAVPLLAIADDAGGAWPARARAALLTVFGRRTETEGNMEAGALLLSDLRAVFFDVSALRLTSADIVARLGGMEERPWPEWRQGKPMTAPQLARALAPFGIRPATLRFGQGTAKGYQKEDFAEAWARYLPAEKPLSAPAGGIDPSHRHNQGKSRASGENGPVTPSPGVTALNHGKAAENLGCDGVTVPHPPMGTEGGSDGWRADL